jgi:DNA-binding beta-propeller fold protein YncE
VVRALLAAIALSALAACAPMASQTPAGIALKEVPNWPALPADTVFGQVTGLGVDSHNHVFVFHRGGRTWTEPFPADAIAKPTVFMLDGDSGRLLAAWGADQFVMPHGLSIDSDDNVWLTDVGLEQIFKFSHDGKKLVTLGVARMTARDSAHFGRPADIAFSGSRMFVADGYVNTRVAVFDPTGSYVESYGGARGLGSDQFDLPHGIAQHGDRLYIADRNNSRLQIWSTDGDAIGSWPRAQVGRPYGVDVRGDGLVAVIDGGDQPDATRATVRLFAPDGALLAARDTRRPGDTANLGHDVAFGPKGAIYVADTWAGRVSKLTID